ncbi:MAG: nucleotidyltransferase family protein [Lysobacterales bacterium]
MTRLKSTYAFELPWLIHEGLAGLALRYCSPLQLSQDVISGLQDWASAYSAQWLTWTGSWKKVLTQLDQPVVLKGVALCDWLYDEPALRPVGDLDILIPWPRRQQASTELQKLGFAPEIALDEDLVMTQQRFTLRRPGRLSCHIDLHWASSNRSLLANALPHCLLAKHRRKTGLGLQPPVALLHAAAHLMGHHKDHSSLKWLMDIHLLWESMDSAQRAAVTDLAVRRQIAPIVSATLTRCATVMGTRHTEIALVQLYRFRHQPCRHYLQGQLTVLQDLAAQPGIQQKLRYLKQTTFPDPNYMAAIGMPSGAVGYLKRLIGGVGKARRLTRPSDKHS